MIFKALTHDGFWEIHWFWEHWRTWERIHQPYDGAVIRGVYLGCFCIACHIPDKGDAQ